jgi:hypothetical protein
VRLDERLHEGAEWQHGQPSLAGVIKRVGDQAVAQPATLETLVDFRVDEGDDPGPGLVLGKRERTAVVGVAARSSARVLLADHGS